MDRSDKLERDHVLMKNEYQALKRKLQSKNEALLILSKDLDQCRSERDQFQLMADQLRSRYQSLKRQSVGLDGCYESYDDTRNMKTCNQLEVDQLKQKVLDAEGDIKLLREQIARQRVGTSDEGMNTRHFPAHEREDLVKQLEASNEKISQMERDLQQVLDEKEELVTERDVYKDKYERLNTELNYILKGDEKRIVDIDALTMENKYLRERLKQMEEEKSMAMARLSKYKNILEKKKNKGILKVSQSRSGGGVVITQKQVEQLVQNKSHIVPSQQTMADLQALTGALLETVNDKNLALSHQRKTNKILGSRVSELENKLKTLEISGLWNLNFSDRISTENDSSLQDLQKECQELKSFTSETDEDKSKPKSIFSKDAIQDNTTNTFSNYIATDKDSSILFKFESEQKDLLGEARILLKYEQTGTSALNSADMSLNGGIPDDDLDLLPTKEFVINSCAIEESTSQENSSHNSSAITTMEDDISDYSDSDSSHVTTPLLSPNKEMLGYQHENSKTQNGCCSDNEGDTELTNQISILLANATDNLCKKETGEQTSCIPLEEEIQSPQCTSPLLGKE